MFFCHRFFFFLMHMTGSHEADHITVLFYLGYSKNSNLFFKAQSDQPCVSCDWQPQCVLESCVITPPAGWRQPLNLTAEKSSSGGAKPNWPHSSRVVDWADRSGSEVQVKARSRSARRSEHLTRLSHFYRLSTNMHWAGGVGCCIVSAASAEEGEEQ